MTAASASPRAYLQWKGEARAFMQRDLSGTDYVYAWADGIHVNIRLEEARSSGTASWSSDPKRTIRKKSDPGVTGLSP